MAQTRTGLLGSTSVARFLGIGRGNARRPRASAETEEEMRKRHARELSEAGHAAAPKPAPTPDDDPDTDPDDDPDADPGGDPEGQSGDRMPPDNDADPDAPPPAMDPDRDGDNDAAEDQEDEDVDQEPDEDMRRAQRRALRRRRRAKARKAERARCAAIFADTGAARNVELAAHLAFNTNLSARQAIGALRRGGNASGLSARMAGAAGSVTTFTGAGRPSGNAPTALAASWDKAMAKARNW